LWLLPLAALLALGPPAPVTAAAFAAAIGIEVVLTSRRLASARAAARTTSARAAARATSEPPAIVLGADPAGRPVTLSEPQLAAHALVIGASGAGKSTTLLTLLGSHIRLGGPAVAIDLKGSPAFARELEHAALQSGRRFRCWTPDGPEVWNPLAHGNPTELKDKLMCTERFSEPHYQRAAERYLQTALQVLIEAHPDQRPTLADVVAVLDSRRMSALLSEMSGPLAERTQDYLAGLGPDQWSAVRGIATRLAILTESHTGAFLGEADGAGQPAVDLRQALAGEEVVLFSLNSSAYGKLAAQLGTLAVQDLVTAAGQRLRDGGGRPALIAIDEFSALETDNVLSLLARGRESGASVLLATQELADLERAARGLRDQVLGNTAVKIAHRQDVPASARMISAMTGTEQVWEQTRQVARSPLVGWRDTGRGTRRLVQRPAIAPEEIESLATGQALLITKIPAASTARVRITRPSARPGPER
jgi:type IV secretory pathway TraG/TraD family ATPase VirD4